MNKVFVEYHKVTGEIKATRIYDSLTIPAQQCIETHDILEYAVPINPNDYYIANPTTVPVVTEKPAITTVATWDDIFILSNGVEEATLGPALPNPSTIYMSIDSAEGAGSISSFEVTDGSLVIKSNVVGIYTFKVISTGYKTYESVIKASANYEIESHNDSVLVTVTAFNYLVPNSSSIEQASTEVIIGYDLISSVTSTIQDVLSPDILHYLVPNNCYAYQDVGVGTVESFLGVANSEIEHNCDEAVIVYRADMTPDNGEIDSDDTSTPVEQW